MPAHLALTDAEAALVGRVLEHAARRDRCPELYAIAARLPRAAEPTEDVAPVNPGRPLPRVRLGTRR